MANTRASTKANTKASKKNAKLTKAAGVMKPENRPKRLSKDLDARILEALGRGKQTKQQLHQNRNAKPSSNRSGSYLIQSDLALKAFSAELAARHKNIKNKVKDRYSDVFEPILYIRAVQIYDGEDNFPMKISEAWNAFVGDQFEDTEVPIQACLARQTSVHLLRTLAGSLGLRIPNGLLYPESEVFGSFQVKARERKRGPRHNNRGKSRAAINDEPDDGDNEDGENGDDEDGENEEDHDGENEEDHDSENEEDQDGENGKSKDGRLDNAESDDAESDNDASDNPDINNADDDSASDDDSVGDD